MLLKSPFTGPPFRDGETHLFSQHGMSVCTICVRPSAAALNERSQAMSCYGHLRTKVLDFRGFDSSRIFILRGGIPRPIGSFPESLSQGILVRIISKGRADLVEVRNQIVVRRLCLMSLFRLVVVLVVFVHLVSIPFACYGRAGLREVRDKIVVRGLGTLVIAAFAHIYIYI